MKKQYLTFNMDGQIYGFPIQRVREINRIAEVTAVPNVSPYFLGVMNLRGTILSVISLRVKLGLLITENTKSTCSIVVESGGLKVATIVDGVRSVVDIEENQIESVMSGFDSDKYIEGFVRHEDKIVTLIDIDKCLFTTSAKEEYEKIASVA